jgi:hypothetical protein
MSPGRGRYLCSCRHPRAHTSRLASAGIGERDHATSWPDDPDRGKPRARSGIDEVADAIASAGWLGTRLSPNAGVRHEAPYDQVG